MLQAGFIIRESLEKLRGCEGFLCHASLYTAVIYVCKGDKRQMLGGPNFGLTIIDGNRFFFRTIAVGG
jgi:hypothetical protein